MTELLRVGWLGLGAMGAPMASRLMAGGFRVAAYDPHPPAGLDMSIGANAADVARNADVLCLMVADAEQLELALFGRDGAADALPPWAVVVVFCTVGPDAVRAAAARLPPELLDAPVSGGPARAARGDLVAMTSGENAAASAALPLLAVLASQVEHFGRDPGTGQAVKMVNQLLAGVHLAAAAEALVLAERLGLPADRVLSLLQHGAAGSFMLADRGPRMLAPQPATAASAVDIFTKDMGLVLAVAGSVGAATPLTEAASTAFRKCAAMGHGRADDSQVILAYRDATLHPAGSPPT